MVFPNLAKLKILLPLLSKMENSQNFLAKALENCEEIILLVVVDKDAMVGQFGFAANDIMQCSQLLEELSNEILKRKIKCEDILEWGNTEQKILQLAELKKVDKIVLLKQGNKYFEDLLKKLQKAKIEIQAIELPAEQPKEEIQKEKTSETKSGQNTIIEAKNEKPVEKKSSEKNAIEKKNGKNIAEKKAIEEKQFNPFDFLKKIKLK